MSDYLHLPSEIWSQILTKLPVKSILRCRCVCQTWYSLISCPNFVSDHAVETLNQSTLKRVLVHTCGNEAGGCKFISQDESLVEPSREHDDIPEDLLSPHVQIVGYSADLFCLSTHAFNTESFLIWNPSIRKLVELPFSSSVKARVRYVLGFGFDSNSGDYKVLRVVYRRRRDLVPTVSEIFDLRTSVWRSLSPPVIPLPFHHKRSSERIYFHPCIDLNGTLHWMANEYSSRCFILSFDLSSEVFRVMETPDGLEIKEYDDKSKVLTINGLLSVALLSWLQGVDDYRCSIWLMKEYGVTESWTKSYVIESSDSLSLSTPFGFREKGEVLLLACAERNNDFEDLVLYDLESKKSTTALVSTNGFIYNLWFYRESLVLL